jgi:hypothetical protein
LASGENAGIVFSTGWALFQPVFAEEGINRIRHMDRKRKSQINVV